MVNKRLFLRIAVLFSILLFNLSAAQADDVIISEDFEFGWGLWSADNGVWQVGVPTVGPAACQSGANCAGTVLNGNYPSDTDSRLISPPVDLPAVTGNEEIYLRFWQWFSYAESCSQDGGRVQISVWDDNAGAWLDWATVSNSICNSSPGWSKMTVELTAYAGERVRTAFYHYAEYGTESTGWYIDDIAIITKVPEFTGDFESGWEDWSADRGVWQVGAPAAGPAACQSGANCAGTVLNGNYPSDTDSRLISAPINLPAVTGDEEIYLSFWQWFSYAESCSQDGGWVQISVWDDGTGAWLDWENISDSICHSSPGWSKMTVELTAYAGERVRTAFYHYAEYGTQSTGWYIDDIAFITKVPEFTGDFESGWEGWSADRGVWQVGAPTVGPTACQGGANCAGTILNGNYPSDTDSRLISPPINLPATPCDGMMFLRFWQWFSYAESCSQDGGWVQISVWDDGAEAWLDWANISSNICHSSPWSPSIIDLTAYAGDRVRIAFYHYAEYGTQSTGWYIDDIELVGISPVIDSTSYDEYVVPPDTSTIDVTAIDPCGGNLTYNWDALDGGEIGGMGAQVQFAPPPEYRFCPYRVRVAVISELTHIGSTKITEIYTRLPGDADENGVVNILDKVLVRNHFGQECDDPDWDAGADVNCDCVVNVLDKVLVRKYFGQSE